MPRIGKLAGIAAAALALGLSGCYVDGDTTYAACDYDVDCSGIDTCWTVETATTYGGFCSYRCSTDRDCESAYGFSGRCYRLGSGPALCYQACDFTSDCYLSSVCAEVDLGRTFDLICIPDN